MSIQLKIQEHLNFLYGPQISNQIFAQLWSRLMHFQQQHPELAAPVDPNERVTEADSILITYGDQIQEAGRPALLSLGEFMRQRLKNIISSVHLLPFYPYSSDDGFSVIDFKVVDLNLGNWDSLKLLREHFRLMFDAVINHISAQSDWFKGFLAGDPPYANYFITIDPATDLRNVTRPRTHPLLTPVETDIGIQHVWTTFSDDQIDLNYKNPQVLLEIIDVLLCYAAEGAEFIRLDAIAYLWKEAGTSCIHLPQTHRVVQLFRSVLDVVAPRAMIITETNVPHQENISYFGNGRNEAQMVYQFTLAPLILHTFHTGSATALQQWAAGLEALPDTATFFNFIASHDGIGVRPAEGILTTEEADALGDKTLDHGGRVSYKTNADGTQSPYELNITLFDALSDPNGGEPEDLKINRFMASQAIMLAMVGVPGIYVHSLVGSPNNIRGMEATGRARTINREKWQRADLEARLDQPDSRPAKVLARYTALLKARAAHPAFHPNGGQHIISDHPALFALLRIAPDTGSSQPEKVVCLHNISAEPQPVDIDLSPYTINNTLRDMLSGETTTLTGSNLRLTLEPYEVKWLG